VRQLESSGNSDITSDDIGALVMEGLAGLDSVAYVRYASVYKDFRATQDFEDPQRVIFDSRLRVSPQSNLAKTARDIPVLLFHDAALKTEASPLKDMGVFLLPIARSSEGLDVAEALSVLRNRGIETLLVEGGGTLAASFLRLGVVDRIDWFRAPIILGGDGRNAVGDLRIEAMQDVFKLPRVHLSELGDDIYERYQRIET